MWEQVVLYHEGDSYFQDIIAAIDQAENEVLIETYIFDVDALTKRILDSLQRARERNVEVYLLVDGVGSYFENFYLGRFCARQGIHFQVYHALPAPVSAPFRFLSRMISNFNFAIRSLNKRNHRKTVLIDNKLCFLGSFNFTSLHCKEFVGNRAWRDSGVQLRGPTLVDIRDLFYFTFMRASLPQKILLKDRRRLNRLYHSNLISINATRSLRLRAQNNLLKRIKSAQEHIRITAAYFLPNPKLLKALIAAQKRGVQVQVIHPSISDTQIVKLAAVQAIHQLLKKGIQIYEYQNRILHAKITTIDQVTYIGSANFNNRSWLHDLEIEAILSDPQSTANLEEQWLRDLQNSRPVNLKDIHKISWPKRLLSKIAYWFSDFL